MPSLLPGYEYDVFISYRQNDNRSGWVTEFVEHLREELAATIKEPVNIYFDENPHDGLQDTHHVDKSLEGKLKCLIFIPIISHTYCDPKSFAWNNEFLPFFRMATEDELGMNVRLLNGNVASRILPVQIHELDAKDQRLFQEVTGSPLRSVDFIFRSQGVNRPLTVHDARSENLGKTLYRDQINKTANALEAILKGITSHEVSESKIAAVMPVSTPPNETKGVEWFWKELLRRHVVRAGLAYLILSLLIVQALALVAQTLNLHKEIIRIAGNILIIGLPVAMVMAWLYEISPHGLIRTTSAQAYTNSFPPERKKPLTSIPMMAVLVIALMLMVVYINIFNQPTQKPQITIGVLPFESRSEQVKDRYIAEGLTDDIINHLVIISEFRVTPDIKPKTDSEKPPSASIAEIIKELDVSMLLTGSVERSGHKMIIRATLYSKDSSKYIWGKTYERPDNNLVDIQTTIVQSVAKRLNVDLNKIEELRLTTTATENPTAYDYYLRGKSLYLKYNREANDSAITMFRQAIVFDQDYARAWAGLGDAYSQMNRFGYEEAWNDSSMAASMKAIRLDSNLSEAYNSLAKAYTVKRLYDKALPMFVKSVELNPRNGRAIGNLGTNYFFRGDLPEALRLQKESAVIDPKNYIPCQIAGWIYLRLGDYDKAEEWLRESIHLDSTVSYTYEKLAFVYIAQGKKDAALGLIPLILKKKPVGHRSLEKAGLIYQYCGKTEQAKAYFEQSISKNNNFSTDKDAVSPIGLGKILLDQGNELRAELLLEHSLELSKQQVDRGSQDDDPLFLIAAVYSILGKNKQSLDWLQKALDAHWLDYVEIANNPWFDNIRNEPRYHQMMTALRQKLDAMRKKAEGL